MNKLRKNLRSVVFVMMMAMIMTCGACSSYKKNIEIIKTDPMAELLYARQSFHDVVVSLNNLQKNGKFTEDQTKIIKNVMSQIDEYLDQWQVDIIEGRERPNALQYFKIKMYDLLIHQWGGE